MERLGRQNYSFPWTNTAGPELEYIRTDRFGDVPAPESLSEFALLLEYIFESGEAILGWRGQSDLDWELDSSAVRRQKDLTPAFDQVGASREAQTLEYEETLLEDSAWSWPRLARWP